MVKLRLARMGKKKQPFYRIVAMEGTAARNSQSLALVGTYDPLKARVDLDEEAALLWLKRGAQMSETVKALFRSQGILARLKGLEGQVREDALKKDKPARRRKLALAGPVEEEAESQRSRKRLLRWKHPQSRKRPSRKLLLRRKRKSRRPSLFLWETASPSLTSSAPKGSAAMSKPRCSHTASTASPNSPAS